MKRLLLTLLLFTSLAMALPGNGKGLRMGTPEEAGLSKERLDRIGRTMQQHIAAGRVAGAIGLIARRGKIGYFETYGMMDKEAGKPMRKDAIFRIYSMTKAVTGVATMILYEENKFSLNDPVSKYLPELGAMKVAVDKKDQETGKRTYFVVPAEREMTIRDLLRHTSGLNYQGPRDEKGDLMYPRLGVNRADITIEEAVKRMGKAPLVHHPGTVWDYSLSIDVLGRLIEVTSGKPLDQFFEERIFKPLGMVDTGFYVPESKWDRLTALYTPNEDRTIKRHPGPPQESYKKPAVLLLGGAGLVSTAMDYARFIQMLLDGGELDGARILGRKSVELMSCDHLGDLPRTGILLPQGYGFGLTFAGNLGPGKTGNIGSTGEYNWGGAAGTRFWIDPKEEMIGIFLVQILPHTNLTYGSEFKQLAYQAIAD
ncbi:MAG: beta-lactamase family protein [Acidobacteria bacterium]|nr:beta-lactamase family protein [Acidobacteriota bacterium]